jgi:hypothetical protein
MKSILLSLLLSIAGSNAALNLSITAAPGEPDVRNPDGTPVSVGSRVVVGYFNDDFSIYTHSSDMDALLLAFNVIGETKTRTLFGQPGRFAEALFSDDDSACGKQAWIWITSGDSHGLFTSTKNDWRIPCSDGDPLGSYTAINSSQVDYSVFGSFNDRSLVVTPVPEPTAWALAIFGFIVGVVWVVSRRWKKGVW